MKKIDPLTHVQFKWLENLSKGISPYIFLGSQSAHGGATRPVWSLRRRGYIDDNGNIASKGRERIGS